MKIIEHNTIPKIDEVKVLTDPLIIWLDTHTELQIERGDRLVKVTKAVKEYFSEHMTILQIRQLVAFWFAMGERSARGRIDAPWTSEEVSIDEERRYLKRRKL